MNCGNKDNVPQTLELFLKAVFLLLL